MITIKALKTLSIKELCEELVKNTYLSKDVLELDFVKRLAGNSKKADFFKIKDEPFSLEFENMNSFNFNGVYDYYKYFYMVAKEIRENYSYNITVKKRLPNKPPNKIEEKTKDLYNGPSLSLTDLQKLIEGLSEDERATCVIAVNADYDCDYYISVIYTSLAVNEDYPKQYKKFLEEKRNVEIFRFLLKVEAPRLDCSPDEADNLVAQLKTSGIIDSGGGVNLEKLKLLTSKKATKNAKK